jgi:hypothetical protein
MTAHALNRMSAVEVKMLLRVNMQTAGGFGW